MKDEIWVSDDDWWAIRITLAEAVVVTFRLSLPNLKSLGCGRRWS